MMVQLIFFNEISYASKFIYENQVLLSIIQKSSLGPCILKTLQIRNVQAPK